MRTHGGRRPLVVGYGNALRGDDAFGWFVAELIADDPRFTDTVVLAVHQLTPELAEDVANASRVVLLDVEMSGRPGGVTLRDVTAAQLDGEAGAGVAMTHHLDAPALLGLAAALYGVAPPAVLLTVGAGSTDVDAGFSTEVLGAISGVIETVAEICAERAHA